jgi:hypothetical protein
MREVRDRLRALDHSGRPTFETESGAGSRGLPEPSRRLDASTRILRSSNSILHLQTLGSTFPFSRTAAGW